MPASFIAVPGTNTRYAAFQATMHNEYETTLVRPAWAYQRRGITTDYNHLFTQFGGQWPNRTGSYGTAATGEGLMGRDTGNGLWNGAFEPWQIGFGTASQKFIMGVCKDEAAATVSGAVVQIFRTTDDLYVGETTADSNGRYEAGTPHTGMQHYLVAYRAGSPDITGATVNTLIPTNRDGT